MKNRWFMVSIVCALTAVVGLTGLVSAGDTQNSSAQAANVLVSIGNKVAPAAAGKISHNAAGQSLDFVLTAENLVPQKEYTLKVGDLALGTAKADQNGKLQLIGSITDSKILSQISSDAQRKFDLWQANQRLSRSAEFFDFTYTP